MQDTSSLATANIQTTGNLNSGTGANSTKPNAYYDKLLLNLLVQTDWHHSKFAQERPMPKHAGDTINFRKITKLAPSLVPLTEGVTPDGLEGGLEAISVSTKQYGEYMMFSDLVDVTMVDPIVKEYTVELARIARELIDTLVRDELNAGSNVFYAGGKASRATLAAGDVPTIDDLRKIVLSMKKNFVKPAKGENFVAFVTPDVAFDLQDDEKFLKAYEIGQNNTPMIKGEIANIYGIHFIEAHNAKVFEDAGASGVDVHSTVVIGQKPYGITKISGEGDTKTIVKGLGSGGTEDPLNQRQSIGFKINAFAVKRLYEEAIVRYESVPSTVA